MTKTNGFAMTGATGQGAEAKPAASLTRCGAGSAPGRTLRDVPVSFQALVIALLGLQAGSPVLSGTAVDVVGDAPAQNSGTVVSSIEAAGGTPGGVHLEGAVRLPLYSGPGGVFSSLPRESQTGGPEELKTEGVQCVDTQAGSGPVLTVYGTKLSPVPGTGQELLHLSTACDSGVLTPALLEPGGGNVSRDDPKALGKGGPGTVDNPLELLGAGAPGEGWDGAFTIREIPAPIGIGFQVRSAPGEVIQCPPDPGHKAPVSVEGNPDPAGKLETPGVIGDGEVVDISEMTPVARGKGAQPGGDEGANLSGEKQKTHGTTQVLAGEPGMTRAAPEFPADKTSAVSGRVPAENSPKLLESSVPSPSGEGARPKAVEMQIVEPELGKLTVLLTSRGSDLNIRFLSPDTRVREVLWETRYELYEAMSGRGLNLAGFSVESGWSSGGEGPAKGRDRVAARAVTVSGPVAQTEPIIALRTRASGLVDYLV